MKESIKARFVGGSRHNEIIECDRLHVIRMIKPVPVTFATLVQNVMPSFETEDYFLCRFFTGWDETRPTVFAQYVHQSLMRDGQPAPESYEVAEPPKLPDLYFHHFVHALLSAAHRR